MIESRYKIEYILPDEEIKKSPSFRVLWYLLLTPLVLLAVTAITYDFSLQNIHKDSLTLFEKAKTHVFNLDTKTRIVNEITNPKLNTPPAEKQRLPLLSAPSISKDEINTDKVTITELTAQQELQLKAIQEQLEKNSKLSTDLNNLSSQLIQEKNINKLLNNQLSQQEIDKLKLTDKLNQILLDTTEKEESSIIKITKSSEVTNDEKELENTVNIEVQNLVDNKGVSTLENTTNKEQSETDKIIEAMETIKPDTSEEIVTIKEINIEVIPEEPIDQKSDATTSLNNVINAVKVISDQKIIANTAESQKTVIIEDQAPPIKEVSELSETEKIIATMSESNTNSEISTEEPSEKIIITDVATSLRDSLGSEKSDNEKVDKEKIKPASIEAEEKNTNQTPALVEFKEEAQNMELVENIEEPIIDIKESSSAAIKEITVTELEKKPDNTDEPQSNSSVDAIIAAMETSQPIPTVAEKNIDPELKKDIKTQLVEQGDISIEE